MPQAGFYIEFNNMDNIDNGPTHMVSPHGNDGSEHFKDILTPDNDTENGQHRHCVSLPLYYDQVSQLIDFQSQMDSFP